MVSTVVIFGSLACQHGVQMDGRYPHILERLKRFEFYISVLSVKIVIILKTTASDGFAKAVEIV